MENAERCMRCGRSEEEVRLFDGIYVTQPVKICEKCSLISNIPIIKRPSAQQLKESEIPYGVRIRLMRLAGLAGEEKKEKSASEELKELEKKPDLERPEEIKFKLVDNFHWVIQTNRRRKGLTAKQLGDSIAESESAIKMLENKSIPENSYNLIKKLEQFFSVRLIKDNSFERIIARENIVAKARDIVLPQEESKEDILGKGDIKIEPEKPRAVSYTSFKREHSSNFHIGDLQRAQKQIDEDMDFSKKSKEEVGKEQMEGFGKEDSDKLKRKVYDSYEKKETKAHGNVPTIYDLVKKREEKEKTSVVGKEIEIIEEKTEKEKWDDLE